MIRDFHFTDETHVGYYVGLIASAFSIAQLATGMPWGMLSDRIGRRPVILMGLASTIITELLFGLSKSYRWALLTKLFSGLLNGNIGVMKSMLSELTTGYSEMRRARAFSMLQVVFGIGSIVGSALGGYLSQPVQKYPYLFNEGSYLTDLFTTYPYLLPCIVASGLSSALWIAGFLFLQETLATKRAKTDPSEAPLLADVDSSYSTFDASQGANNTVSVNPPRLSLKEALTRPVLLICFNYALVSYQNVFYDDLVSIWSASRRHLGGLGLTSAEIGTALSFGGCVTLFVQIFLFHHLTRYFGCLNLFRRVLFLSILVFFTHGFIRLLYDVPDFSGGSGSKFWVRIGLFVGIALKTLCQTVAYTSGIMLTSNAAPRADALGTINGFSQSVASAMRATGSASSGFVWSTALRMQWLPLMIRAHISWTVLACIAFITFFVSTRLNPFNYKTPKNPDEVIIDTSDEDSHR
ncbi:major facilitator superfamily domain-containing protein [Radiomyces spectabilis]|uniref:major facilitator superfamily domain-containing protein n=1 Tax=Radiomyces spectabilis TaxID=64574 RepID=UPI002220C6DB|nr:major facilitator superfamily domain-containing protein [Radiomyces spectabilis]KAI8393667.1 major facilitator superfamily domain-containing protein [Radiomyces spectabilis]